MISAHSRFSAAATADDPSSFRNAVHAGPTSFLQYRPLDMTKYQVKIIEGITPVLTATSFGSASSDATLFELWSRDL